MPSKKKFFLLTTVPMSLHFFKDQIRELNHFFAVTLVSTPDRLLEEIAIEEGVKQNGIEMKREINLLSDFISLCSLLWLFVKERPRVIHCNTPKASLLGLIAGWLLGVPIRIYYIHGLRYEGTVGNKRKLLVVMEKLACFCATKIIAVSYGVKEKVQYELTSKKVDVIHYGSANGMDVEEFINTKYDIQQICNEVGIEESDFVFGFVGRIVGDKGINELVHSFNELNQKVTNIKLLLVGFYENGLDPLQQQTLKLIKSNPNIIEVGFQKDVKKYLSIIDIFVSPSYREGFGLSLLEANLMGKPVIATKITGYSEIVEEGVNGFLVPSKDIDSLRDKMEWAYHNSNHLLNMKKGCITKVIENYNHKDVLREALKYYKNL